MVVVHPKAILEMETRSGEVLAELARLQQVLTCVQNAYGAQRLIIRCSGPPEHVTTAAFRGSFSLSKVKQERLSSGQPEAGLFVC